MREKEVWEGEKGKGRVLKDLLGRVEKMGVSEAVGCQAQQKC